ncbi:DUF1876 domain-containing protein [Dactylosporangium sp. NPDC049140]|uniref:DUF1876 domain-containing protein n=1 Tax=Dactylosporangium sp. NPDC049140 TaxID=3155647 RepID=UPI0033ECCF85
MTAIKQWTVNIFIGEHDGRTYAEARLHTDDNTHIAGTGEARLHPADKDVPEIGNELAAARALADLGHQLLATTAADIQAISHRPVHLHR